MLQMTHEPSATLDAIAHEIVGAAVEVHKILGPGFLESVYERALCVELSLRHIQFQTQQSLPLTYKGEAVGDGKLDLLVENSVIVELKTVDSLLPIHTAQLISYLKATGLQLGLLINFNVPVLKDGIKRVVLSQ